jgi:ADP-ribose pyrophosphatase YjhB (NUDIX family)
VTCEACTTSHWLNPKPCANAIVVEHEKVLLVRRGYAASPWYGSWCAPGGFCEVGEHPIATAEREVREETGVAVAVTDYIGVWVDEYATEPGRGDAETINVAYYLAVRASEDDGSFDPLEVSEVGWFHWDRVPADLAPPVTLATVLTAARQRLAASADFSPLPDRPR